MWSFILQLKLEKFNILCCYATEVLKEKLDDGTDFYMKIDNYCVPVKDE